MLLISLALALLASTPNVAIAFSPIPSPKNAVHIGTQLHSHESFFPGYDAVLDQSNQNNEMNRKNTQSRRSALSQLAKITIAGAGLASSIVSPDLALAEAETMERGGVRLTPFNSLAFNYRGGTNPTQDASGLNEPSVSYADFLQRLDSDQVAFVEFLAPNGDVAYATFKSTDSASSGPIRIGEGYPLEDPEGWSSPAFVIKAVAKKGVPYKFVVPALANYK